jgi:glycosyltransferase involved in cell wall biosynthesis
MSADQNDSRCVPLVSAVVTARNEQTVLGRLLQSLRDQRYPAIEVIVVDNHSTDTTPQIAREFGARVFNYGPERSAQRNYGAQQARGQYVLILDADMEITRDVIAQCVAELRRDLHAKGVIVPEESYGLTFWARCKALERSCYIGDASIEAARFFDRDAFLELGGYDLGMTGPEDWDLSQRVRQRYGLARVRATIRHNEGRLSLLKTARKKYYYAATFARYAARHPHAAVKQANLVFRPAYFRSWKRLIRHPILLAGMLVMRTVELASAGAGFLTATIRSRYHVGLSWRN